MDPNLRVREAQALVFPRFSELQSIRQVHSRAQERWDHAAPDLSHARDSMIGCLEAACHNTVHQILTNPIYGGAYTFGRTCSRVTIEEGRKRIACSFRLEQAARQVLIPDHHEDYVSWPDFERNQRLIANNATSEGMMPAARCAMVSSCSAAYCAAVIAVE